MNEWVLLLGGIILNLIGMTLSERQPILSVSMCLIVMAIAAHIHNRRHHD